VLLPVMKEIRMRVQEPYVMLDREHTTFKQKLNGRGQATVVKPMHTEDLTKLIRVMERIVRLVDQ
jgi:hypothetical protein